MGDVYRFFSILDDGSDGWSRFVVKREFGSGGVVL